MKKQETIEKILNKLINTMNFVDIINLAKENDEIKLENIDYLRHCPEFIISHNDIGNFNDNGFTSETIHDFFSFTINDELITDPIKLFKNHENVNSITFKGDYSKRTYVLKNGFSCNNDNYYVSFESDAHNLKGSAIIVKYKNTLNETYCINGIELDKITFKEIIRKLKFSKILQNSHDIDYFIDIYSTEKIKERNMNKE